MCCALLDSSHETIPNKNDNSCRDFIVPGYNDYAKELHCKALTPKKATLPGSVLVDRVLEFFVVI